jgi:tetratricopeptide (TPR) repeat protein
MTVNDALQEALRLHQAGHIAQAEVLYRQVLAIDPCNCDALHLLGVAARQSGQFDAALDLIGRAISNSPSTAYFHSALGLVFFEMKRLEESAQAYWQSIRLQPDFPEAWNNLGNTLSHQHRTDEALSAYQRSIDLRPDYTTGLQNLGGLLYRLGRLDEAAAAYEHYLKLKPNSPDVLCDLGVILHNQCQFRQAIAIYRQALAVNPTYFHAMNNMGAAFSKLQRYEDSIRWYRKALAIDPNDYSTLCNLGSVLWKAEEPDEAILILQKAIAISPERPEAHSQLGLALYWKGDLDQAIAASRQALALQPDFSEAFRNLGCFLFEKNQSQEAIAALRQSLALAPTDEMALFHLTTVLAAEGLFDQVMAEYRRSTTSSPASDSSISQLPLPQLPYLGDRILMLSCPPQLRDELRARGLCDWIPNLPEYPEFDPISFTLSIPDGDERTSSLRLFIDEASRNAAAMSGNICTIWTQDIPESLAPALRQAAGPDRLEIAAQSVPDLIRRLEPHAKPRPDTAGKVFAVCSIRNGPIDLLPHWLEHYTNLGADKLLLGLFDDVSPTLRDQISLFEGRWQFTCFNQRWNGIEEFRTEWGRRSGCRLAGALPETWILHTDLDELHEFPAPLKQITAAADAKNIPAVIGWLLDRVAPDGSLPSILPTPSLWDQFPIGCRLTAKILHTLTEKIMLARFSVPIRNGHHHVQGNTPLGQVPLGRPDQYIVHHFKWHGDLSARIAWSLSQPNTQREWKNEASRFLSWFKFAGGRIDVDDPVLQALRQTKMQNYEW